MEPVGPDQEVAAFFPPIGEARHDAFPVLLETPEIGIYSHRVVRFERPEKRLLEIRAVQGDGDVRKTLLHRGSRNLVEHFAV